MILKKEGFYRTMDILYGSNGEMSKKDFNKRINDVSYDNAYYRVRDQLLELGIIEINEKGIKLTPKGQEISILYEGLKRRLGAK